MKETQKRTYATKIQETPYLILAGLTTLAFAVAATGVFGVPAPQLLPVDIAFVAIGASLLILASSLVATQVILQGTQRRVINVVSELEQTHARVRDIDDSIAEDDLDLDDNRNDPTRVHLFESLADRVATLHNRVDVLQRAVNAKADQIRPALIRSEGKDVDGYYYPVDDISGIGSKTAARLSLAGIFNTGDLVTASQTELAQIADVPPNTAYEWQREAELMSLHGIGPHFAGILTRAGLDSVEKLAHADPASVVTRIEQTPNGRTVAREHHIGQALTSRWIDAAETQLRQRPATAPRVAAARPVQ